MLQYNFGQTVAKSLRAPLYPEAFSVVWTEPPFVAKNFNATVAGDVLDKRLMKTLLCFNMKMLPYTKPSQ